MARPWSFGRNYTIQAAAAGKQSLHQLDQRRQSGALTNTPGGPSLTFMMYTNMIFAGQLRDQPVPGGGGSHNGLFYPAGGVTEAGSGFLTATVSSASNSAGTYSANCCWMAAPIPSAGPLI